MFTFLKQNSFSTEAGFTIIEILVSLSLIATIGSVIGSIIFSSTRDVAKADNVALVRQNGDYAISQMVKTIRNGVGISSCSSSSLAVGNNDGSTTTFSCTTISCPSSPNINPASITVTDSSGVTPLVDCAVTIASCNFSCTQSSGYFNVAISFTASNNTTSNLLEQKSSIPFQSQVTLRNLSQ